MISFISKTLLENLWFMIVKGNREESNEQTNSLKAEVLERLARTRDAISEVEGKTSSSLSSVFENINTSEEKHEASIVELSDSLVVSRSWLLVFCLLDLFVSEYGEQSRGEAGRESSTSSLQGNKKIKHEEILL